MLKCEECSLAGSYVCSRYDFDFFFALQQIVNDLVKDDFLD